jgi:predicted DNA-binding transcriptional regulator YafY
MMKIGVYVLPVHVSVMLRQLQIYEIFSQFPYFGRLLLTFMEETLNRFDRTVALLIQLQSKRVVRAQDLADRFQVSLRTIYRDIRALEAAGVPVVSEAGVGYSIMEGYRLPPVMFTREEAASFVAAEKLMQHFTDKTLGAHYTSAMYKIKSVLRGSEKDWVETLEESVAVKPMRAPFNENIPDALEILFESIAARKAVQLQYRSQGAKEPSERLIEPVGVFHEYNWWYVMAYCLLRNDYRQFRADRILAIRRTDRPFTREHQPLHAYRGQGNGKEKKKHRVRLLVDADTHGYMKESRSYHGFVSEEAQGDASVWTFEVTDLKEGFARWFVMFGDCAEILEPQLLKDYVRDLIEKTARRL